jgi:hypothetical protein
MATEKITDAIPIQEYLSESKSVNANSKLSNVFMKFTQYDSEYNVWDKKYDVKYNVMIGNNEGEFMNGNYTLTRSGFQALMKLIQTNKLSTFSDLYILVLEEIAKYKKGTDIHYYLKIILDKPGVAPSIPKVKKKVPVCRECDSMLLRFGFKWKIQRDDLNAKTCPYCRKPLEKEERYRKLIKVALDFDEEGCIVDETRAQIGIIYNDIKLKSTLNPKGIADYLSNYQALFTNNTMGPLVVSFGRKHTIKGIQADIIAEIIEWRPACLFPEDLVAF